MDRDQALKQAITDAHDGMIRCVGQDAKSRLWVVWLYGFIGRSGIDEASRRYVLPNGEVTKLS